MRDQSATSSNLFSFISNHKRASLSFAGAFAAAGLVTTIGVQAHTASEAITPSSHIQATTLTTSSSDDPSVTPDQSDNNVTVTSQSNTGTDGTQNVQLTVNGEDVPVPTGTSQQTITSSDGSQTTITTNHTSTGSGQATNNYSSSVTMNVTSGSSSNIGGSKP
jgi:hypothetical protein